MTTFRIHPGMVSFETICRNQKKESLYRTVNHRFGTSFKVGDIEEFENDSIRTQLSGDDIVRIIENK